ncbi:MAG: SDR family NAD(P)-dependent oxidoreductase, partial [Rhodococcus sp. (in: high G+C Gram-positive bacteria)]
PVAAALRTLPRILGQEAPGLRWAAVDVDSVLNAEDCADVVLGEVIDALGRPATRPASDVTVRSGVRWESALTSWSAVETVATAVVPGTKALIVGGSGAVGRLIGRHLAGLGYDVVSTSRRERSEPGSTAHPIRHVVGDATDAADLARLVSSLDADAGPIGLVVHAAGLAASLAPVTLTSAGHDAKFGDAARAHMDAKLAVAQNIRNAISGLPEGRRPTAVLCMSSATGVLGGIGMGPYAASNTAMDAYAVSVSGRRVRWVSIVWDGWRADLEEVGRESAISAIAMSGALDAETGLTAFDRIAALAFAGRSPAVVAVGTSGLGPRSRAASIPRPRAAAGAFLSGLTDTQQGVAEVWSEMFGAPVTDPDADFFALGGHSLLGTRMLDSVRQRFGVELGLRELLTAATLAQFSDRIDAAKTLAAPSDDTAVSTLSEVLRDDGTFDMTRVQHAYWIGRNGGYAWGEVPCHFYLEYDCVDLDLERYNRALDAVIARHPMLRTVATSDGRLRTLDSVPPYRIRTRELVSADDESRERTLGTIRRRVAEKPGPPDRWPLVQIEAARTDRNRTRLFIGVDVLICDAASWWIIESELKALYEHPETPLPALDLHPAQCSSAMAQRRRGPGGVRAEHYWLARAESVPGPPELPIRPGFDGRPRFVRRATALRPEQWSRFALECRRHRITPTAALLTLYTDSLRAWSRTQHFSVVLTLFDRPPFHPDVNKVVGDFTSLILHESGPHAASSFVDRAQATQRRMFDDLDHRQYSALELLAEQSRRSGEQCSVPVVFTGALGVHDMVDDSGSLEWVGTQVHAVGQTPQTWLDHQVLEQDGELRLQWDVVDGLFADSELEHLVARHTEAATQLADDAGAWTRTHDHGAVPQIDPADVLVPLRGSGATAGSERPTLFLVHPSGGDVLCYAELSRRLTTEVAVVALTDPQLTVDAGGCDSIEGIAAQYVSALRSQYSTPPGGWLLGGWSMGGSLAQEMARQLHDDGERTALIVMLDSNDPTYITAIDGTAATVELEVARRHLGALESFLDIDLGIGDAAWNEIVELEPDARNSVIAAKLRSRKLLGPRDDGLSRREVFGRHLAALARHTPRLHPDADTETLLVRCTRRAPNNSGIGMGIDDTPSAFSADLGWSRHLAGRLTVVAADAHHYSMLREPALDDVVEHLDHALRTALDRP